MAKAAAKPAKKAAAGGGKKSHTKAELVEKLATSLDTTKTHASDAFDKVVDLLKASLKGNGVLTVPQFGTFHVVALKARKGRNPRTNQEITIKASKTIRFKPSIGLKKEYNPGK